MQHGANLPMAKIRSILDLLATLAIIATCGALLYSMFLTTRTGGGPSQPPAAAAANTPPPLPKEPISLAEAITRGNAGAKVAIVEFSDFQCPYCGQFARETFPELEKSYIDSGKVLFAFRHLPLTRIHPFSQKASEAASCAGQQGRFWEMHDLLFGDQKALETESLLARAEKLGLDNTRFVACLAGQMTNRIKNDTKLAADLKVSGTPTFLIGTVEQGGHVKVSDRLSGAQPVKQFQAVLDRLLAGNVARR